MEEPLRRRDRRSNTSPPLQRRLSQAVLGSDTDGASQRRGNSVERRGSTGSVSLLAEESEHTLSEHWVRYFAAEMVGSLFFQLLGSMAAWTQYYDTSVAWQKANRDQHNSAHPYVNLLCNYTALGDASCRGEILNPLAGAAWPSNILIDCAIVGLAFACSSMTAPGATLNPALTTMMCVWGMKRWSLWLPSVLGQLTGIIAANGLIHAMLRERLTLLVQEAGRNATQAEILKYGQAFFGLTFPAPHITNWFAWVYTMLASAVFVFVMTPVAMRSATLPALARNLAIGLTISIHGAAFGANGFGYVANPSQWMGGALFVTMLHGPVGIWSQNNYFAFKIPLWAPTVGVIVGAWLCVAYARAIAHRAQ